MSSESDLHLPTIVPLLQPKTATAKDTDARQALPASPSESMIMQHPHLVPSSLKVETTLLTKELAKFRPCDQNTCFYCREWAQWVFKKTFGKEKNSTTSNADKKGARAGGSANSTSSTEAVSKKKHKEYAMVVCERFYQRSTADSTPNGGTAHSRASAGRGGTGVTGAGSVAAAAIAASKAGTGPASSPSAVSGQEGFVAEIVDTVRDWIQQPSALYTSPEVFSLVEFEALYAAYPLQNQEQNQARDDVTPILSTITIEKAHMILGHQGYPLLKRVTKAQLQNQIMTPTCQHTKGQSKTPADLELDKELFNEELKRMRMRDQEGLRKQIGPVWRHVEEALERMDGAEKVRSGILGPSRAKEFTQTYKEQLISFQEIWQAAEAVVKKTSSKKRGSASDGSATDPVEEIDQRFKLFIDNMKHIHQQLTADVLESSERSLREFIKELAAAQAQILKLALTRIQEGKVGTARIDKILEESPEKCRNALKMVEQLIPIFDTKMGQFRTMVLNKLREVDEEVDSVASAYWNESHKTAQGRLEKAANKDFRRRIKKLEFLSVETRKWFFQSRLTLFSSLDFATVCLNTLGILMEEAEVLEAVQLGLHDDHFRSRVLKSQEGRLKLAQQFREGVKTGRRVLAVMVSRLMMREGARAMGEMAAIQKEKKFLKSIGQDVSDSKFSTKGYLVPSRDATPTASAQVSDDEDLDGDANAGTATVSKNKKKKDKKKKKAAEAAALAAAENEAMEEPEEEVIIPEVPPAIVTATVEPLTAFNAKEARELKKQAKKDAKKQAKEAAEAEESAIAQEAAKKAEGARRVRELREAQEALERQEAQELRDKREAQMLQEKRAAQQAREAESAKAKKETEEAEARKKAQEAREVEEAMERQRARELKESHMANKTSTQEAKEVASTVTAPATSAAQVLATAKVPTWGPSAATLANRAASASKEAERAQQSNAKADTPSESNRPGTRHSNSHLAQKPTAPEVTHLDTGVNLPKATTETRPTSTTTAANTPLAAELEHDEHGAGQIEEDLARLPNQTLVSLVHTLQVENKSLLTTLVSMQQQVSSLTERYSTLATLAREHEQQAIQAMEAQKQREMEDIQRYVWKVEERCRQLEKHVLATHQHRQQQMHMHQMQQQQQQQHHQQQHQQHSHLQSSTSSSSSASSGPPGLSVMSNLSMPPPGFSNLLGLGRQPSAPSSPSMSHRHLNGLDQGPSSPSSGMAFQNMAPMTSSPSLSGLMSSSSGGGSIETSMSPLAMPLMTSNESGPKKTHWRQRGEVRCGNCAQLGHSSAECQAGCRYCDQSGHLSQDCPRMATSLV